MLLLKCVQVIVRGSSSPLCKSGLIIQLSLIPTIAGEHRGIHLNLDFWQSGLAMRKLRTLQILHVFKSLGQTWDIFENVVQILRTWRYRLFPTRRLNLVRLAKNRNLVFVTFELKWSRLKLKRVGLVNHQCLRLIERPIDHKILPIEIALTSLVQIRVWLRIKRWLPIVEKF